MADAPKRIQRRRSKGWKMPENAVSVTRPSEWGNPFAVSKYTNVTEGRPEWWVETAAHAWRFQSPEEAAGAAVTMYRAWLRLPQQDRLRERAKLALRGKDLACWCKPGAPCHADVLLDLVNAAPAGGRGEE